MNDPDIDLLIRLRKRIPRVRALANRLPDDADELDLLAYDLEMVWRLARAALGRVAELESTPGALSLSQHAMPREVYDAPPYERRPSSVVSFVIEGVSPSDVRIESPTAYAQIKKRG